MSKKYIIYDLEANPNSFDAFVFFVIFRIYSDFGDHDNLSIVILYPIDKDINTIDRDKYQARIDNLIPSIVKLHFGNVKTILLKDRNDVIPIIDDSKNTIYPNGYTPSNPKPYFELKYIINKKNRFRSFRFHIDKISKEIVQSWINTQNKKAIPEIVTITIRSTNYQLERNSNLTEWEKVAKKITSEGFLIIFIPDMECENELMSLRKRFLFYDNASKDLQIRTALYEKSYLNLILNHGPSSLCLFNHNCSYLYFKPIVDSSQCSSLDALEKQGWMPGDQWPYSTCNQKIIWYKDDSFIILLAFEAFASLRNKTQVSSLKTKLKSKINSLLAEKDYYSAEKYLIVFDSMFDEPNFSSFNLFKLHCENKKFRYAFFFGIKAWKSIGLKELKMHLPEGLRKLLPIFINKGNEWPLTFKNQEDIIKNIDVSLNYHIYGTGLLAKKTHKYLEKFIAIRGFTDNYKSNESNLNGLKIVNPKRLINNENVMIIIASQFHKDIIFDLLEIGFSLDSIAISNLDPNVDF